MLPGRHEPGTGTMDWQARLDRLDRNGYRGMVGLEYNPRPTPESLAALAQPLNKHTAPPTEEFMADYRISFQLYSARNEPPLVAQLEALAAIGFDAVESWGRRPQRRPRRLPPPARCGGACAAPLPISRLPSSTPISARSSASRKRSASETAIVPWLAPG